MEAAFFVIAGLLPLVAAVELVIRSASQIAGLLGVSPFRIGLTIVSIGTSATEFAVGVIAGSQGDEALVVTFRPIGTTPKQPSVKNAMSSDANKVSLTLRNHSPDLLATLRAVV